MNQLLNISSRHWQVQIDPVRGANLVIAKYDGQDVLYPVSDEQTNPYLGGAPLLLPANRTANGTFTFEGKQYTLPVNELSSGANLHGNLHRQTFSVRVHEPDRAVLAYANADEIYPFAFRMEAEYRVDDTSLYSIYRIGNPSDCPMPITFALHTTFVEPEWFSVPLRAQQERDLHNIPTGRILPLNPQEQGYVTGSPSRGLVISGYYQSAGHTAQIGSHIRYEASGFDHWILFNGKGTSNLLCVEPQIGAVNALNDPQHCPIILPESVMTLQTRIEWING